LLKYILTIVLLIASAVFAEDKVNLEADKVTSIDNNTVFAEGSVLVTYKNIILTSDNLTYHKDTNSAEASGNVIFQDDYNYLTATYLKIDLTTKKGIIENGKGFYAPHTYFNAKKIEKTGENSFILQNAVITSCNQKNPDWYFYSRTAKIDYGEYFKSRDTTFNISDIPVLYTPYFIWPIKKKRESGFLIPDIGFKTDAGFFVTPKYFLDLGLNKDFTFGANLFSLKGPMLNTEFRYEKSSKESIYMYGELIDDKNSKSNKTTRWRLVNKSNIYLAKNLELKFNIDYVSDFKYKEDFDEFAIKSDKFEVENDENYSINEIRLNYNLKYSNISLRYLDNMHYYKNNDGFTKNHIIRKPNIIFEKYGLKFSKIKADYFADFNKILYTNYIYNIDGSENSNKIEYDRYFAKIKIYKPFDIKVATLTPHFTQTVTHWNNLNNISTLKDNDFEKSFLKVKYNSDSISRSIYSYGAKLSFNELYKHYKSFKHSIFNTFEYKVTPYLDQSALPNLIENDVISAENYYGYTMTNYFKGNDWSMKLEINQKYNLSKSEEKFEPLYVDSSFSYKELININIKNSYDYYEKQSTYFKNSYRLKLSKFYFYTEYVFDDTITDYNTTLKYNITYNAVKFNFNIYEKFGSYEENIKLSNLKKQELGLKGVYKSDCWSIGLLLKENYYDIIEENSVNTKTERTVYLIFEFKGLGGAERKILESK